jgi:hypothetical protein
MLSNDTHKTNIRNNIYMIVDIDIYLASVLLHLVTIDVSIFIQLKYSLIKYQQ